MQVVGVDGCPGGWIAVVWDIHNETWTPHNHAGIIDVLTVHRDVACIGIDIPIGLRDDGAARRCDVEARQLLGWPRMASVFPAPQRRLLTCQSYAEAAEASLTHFGKGISRQSFGIMKKIYEVDGVMTPELQHRLIEVHPEVSFRAMNDGRPMIHSKKRTDGFAERRDLLVRQVSASVPETRAEARKLAPYAGPDDLLDALAAAWTARRYAECCAERVPEKPELDDRGLRMEIVY